MTATDRNATAPAPLQSFKVKTLSYNIHKGFSMGNQRFVLARIRAALRGIQADVVFLQEVSGGHQGRRRNRFQNHPQPAYLADTLWPYVAYGKNAVYRAGHHGNAVLSKFPIIRWENEDVSTNPFERRGLLHAALKTPNRDVELHVICLHLNLLKRGRLKQVEQLCGRIEASVPPEAPLIVAGDFNDWRVEISSILRRRLHLQEAHEHLHERHARTFPSWLPVFKLDRIYFRGFTPLRAKPMKGRPWRTLSDHTAIFTELVLDP